MAPGRLHRLIFFPVERAALFSDSKLGNHFSVAVRIVHPQIIEQAAAFADDFQQAATRSMIFFVCFEMLGEISDALAKQSDLNFRGTRIGTVDSILGNDVSFIFLGQAHSYVQSLSLRYRLAYCFNLNLSRLAQL